MTKLKKISEAVRQFLEENPQISKNLKFQNYHGFQKARIDKEIPDLLKSLSLNPKEIQIEIVSVNKDLSNEIHKHQRAHAYCVILGKKEHFPEAKNAFVYFKSKWIEISSEEHMDRN